jgi:apolipoprotein D and lipocalin family protein
LRLSRWIFLAAAIGLPLGAGADITRMDAQRFSGLWFQVARVDKTSDGDDCDSDITAHYAVRADGSLKVTRSCRTPTGRVQTDSAVAKPQPARPHETSAHWTVSSMPRWLRWLPVGQDDMWVVMLDPQYRFAVLSDAPRRQLTLLSRSPTLPADDLGRIVDRLAAAGYPTGRLVLTRQGSSENGETGPELAAPFTGRPRPALRHGAASDAA